MKLLIAAALAAAFVQQATTLQNVIAKGITMEVFGMQVPVTYTPDGKWTARPPGEPITGTWRIEGDKLCTSAGPDPEVCVVYPAGKKSGDAFDVPGAMGPSMGTVKVRIN
jgi:hypothetical protein